MEAPDFSVCILIGLVTLLLLYSIPSIILSLLEWILKKRKIIGTFCMVTLGIAVLLAIIIFSIVIIIHNI